MNEIEIIQLLNDANIVEKRIFPTVAPKDTPFPQGRYSIITTPEYSTLEHDIAYRIRLDLIFWAYTYAEIKQIEQETRNALLCHGYEDSSITSSDLDEEYQRLQMSWRFIET